MKYENRFSAKLKINMKQMFKKAIFVFLNKFRMNQKFLTTRKEKNTLSCMKFHKNHCY